MRSISTLILLGIGACFGVPESARADSYFVMIFGGQRAVIKAARHSHSWATFVRIRDEGPLECFTISWLPVDGRVRPLALLPEEGRNWGLQETLNLCSENNMVVAVWGPYQIDPDLWNRALHQKLKLESGQVAYKAYDFGSRQGTISNCIHACAIITREPGEPPRVIVAPANWGESGSYWIALTMRPWYLDPCQKHFWVMERLGLCPKDFIHHDLDRNPTRAPGIRVVQGMLQFWLLPNRVSCD